MLHVKLGRFVLSSQWRACAQHRVQHAHSALNQTTVVRRIAHMEEVLGGVLFERKQGALRLTPFGQRVATAAARVESEILALESALHAEQRAHSGKIRFTCSEAMATSSAAYRDIIVDLIADDHFLDLAVGEADVALRAGSRPEGAGIVARRPQDTSGVFIAATHTPSSTIEIRTGRRDVALFPR
jgi:DNA-binding transcriptional LysR family regulator